MRATLIQLLKEEQGQDLVEYTLLIAFVCLASAAMYINGGGSITGIWTTTNTQLQAGNASAAS